MIAVTAKRFALSGSVAVAVCVVVATPIASIATMSDEAALAAAAVAQPSSVGVPELIMYPPPTPVSPPLDPHRRSGQMEMPTDPVVLSARFRESSEHWKRKHTGLDFNAPTGAVVAAALAGRVVYARPDGDLGKLVIIRHADRLETAYAHMSGVLVDKGDQVTAGQPVGLVGSTGNSTGPHLHFETRIDGKSRNPSLLLWGELR